MLEHLNSFPYSKLSRYSETVERRAAIRFLNMCNKYIHLAKSITLNINFFLFSEYRFAPLHSREMSKNKQPTYKAVLRIIERLSVRITRNIFLHIKGKANNNR